MTLLDFEINDNNVVNNGFLLLFVGWCGWMAWLFIRQLIRVFRIYSNVG